MDQEDFEEMGSCGCGCLWMMLMLVLVILMLGVVRRAWIWAFA